MMFRDDVVNDGVAVVPLLMLVVEGGEIAEYVVPHIPRCRLERVGFSLGPVVAILRSWGPVSYGHCYGDSYVHSYRDSYGDSYRR